MAAVSAKGIMAYEVITHLRQSEKEFYQQEMSEAVERVSFLHETRELDGEE